MKNEEWSLFLSGITESRVFFFFLQKFLAVIFPWKKIADKGVSKQRSFPRVTFRCLVLVRANPIIVKCASRLYFPPVRLSIHADLVFQAPKILTNVFENADYTKSCYCKKECCEKLEILKRSASYFPRVFRLGGSVFKFFRVSVWMENFWCVFKAKTPS